MERSERRYPTTSAPLRERPALKAAKRTVKKNNKDSNPPASSAGNASSAATQPLRIIGGQWRGRKLSFPAIEGLRPTGDRVRETLFNWLAPILPGARCLDLYAGSGALGLEALSRGADFSVMLEKDSEAARQLRANLSLLNCDRGQVQTEDSLVWLSRGPEGAPFDVVFVDPPFERRLWQASINRLEQEGWLAQDAAVYLESDREMEPTVPEHWRLHRDKTSGKVRYRLYFVTGLSDAGH